MRALAQADSLTQRARRALPGGALAANGFAHGHRGSVSKAAAFAPARYQSGYSGSPSRRQLRHLARKGLILALAGLAISPRRIGLGSDLIGLARIGIGRDFDFAPDPWGHARGRPRAEGAPPDGGDHGAWGGTVRGPCGSMARHFASAVDRPSGRG